MPLNGHKFSPLRHLLVQAALGLSLVVGAAHAAPADELDPVTRLLTDKGLLPAGSVVSGRQPPDATPLEGISPQPPQGLMSQARDRASDMVISAMNFLGVPYRRGGTDANSGFDCSGFTRHIFEKSLGLVLPRRADEQANAGGLISIRRDELKPGDLVFFNTLRRTFSHVGIYVGDGKFIHSPRAGGSVRVEDMRMSYWQNRFTGARRVDALSATAIANEQRSSGSR
jgi:NlpC/P60 family